jgi:exopolyphosphatase/guanosine-5'-triphosphate,3'-diphosphate pyrophosphatase
VNEEAVGKARALARDALKPLTEHGSVERVAFVGGSATTAATIMRGKPSPITSYPVTRAELQRTLERLLAMTLDERKKVVGMKAQRADILPAGVIVLDTALEMLEQERAIATTADLLLGILLQERDAAGGRLDYERQPDTRAYRKPRR